MWFETVQVWIEFLRERPILVLMAVTLPLFLLAKRRHIFPHTPVVVLLIVPAVLTLLLLWKRDILPVILAIDLAILALAIWDLCCMPRENRFAVERRTQKIASLQKPHEVTLTISNLDRREHVIWVKDDLDQDFQPDPDDFLVRLPPKSRSVLRYEIRAFRRGAFQMKCVYVRVRSPWGMWRRIHAYPLETVIHVYPDMQQLSKYAILARTNHLSLMGVRRTRRIGQDNEFERLRDFGIDDNYKHIDWRSSARRNKLTVKDYQTSQSQRLIFLVDCGRMMTNESSGISLLDHALNSMLMLSYVALRQGDSVGMIGFSDRIHAFVPPRGGMSQMNHMLHASFDRFPDLVESRYDQAFLHLSSYCQKRSLVILITNVIDEVNANQIYKYLSSLVGRHLPLGILLRDYRLFDAADRMNPRGEEMFRSAAAAEILTWRHQVITDLEHGGVLSLDVFPEEMTAPLVNKYLEIKARHLL